MSSGPTVSCPQCGIILENQGLQPGVSVQCAKCGAQFPFPSLAVAAETSGKAIASLVLGLVSVVGICFTGIPAIILGIVALGETGRGPGRLRGRGMAIGGIVTGSLCGLLCLPLFSLIFIGAREVAKGATEVGPQVAAIASKMGVPDAPEGIGPIFGMDVSSFGFKMAVYGDKKERASTLVIVMQFPAWIPLDRQQMEEQVNKALRDQDQDAINVEETRQVTYTIRGKPVQVTELIGKQRKSGERGRQYIALLPSDAGPMMVMLMTGDPPEDDSNEDESRKKVRLSEEQVKEFFESFQ